MSPLQESTFSPKVKHYSLLGKVTFEALAEIATKSQTSQVAWRHYSFQTLVEIRAQSQAEQCALESSSFEALVKLRSKSQSL